MAESKIEENKTSNVSFNIVSAVDSIATNVRRERESVEEILDFDSKRKNIQDRIIAAAKERGEVFTEDDITKATDMYFDREHRFVEYPESFGAKMFDMYMNRARIAKGFGKFVVAPALTVLLAVGAITGTAKLVKNARLAAAEGEAETAVQLAYNEKNELSSKIQKDLALADTKELSASDKKQAFDYLEDAKRNLAAGDDFFAKFCRNGNVQEGVTRENYEAAMVEVKKVRASFTQADGDVKGAEGIFETFDKLASAQGSLESLILQARESRAPGKLLSGAESAYKSGLACIARKDLAGAESYKRELGGIIGDARAFATLPDQEAKVYAAINAVIARDEYEGRQIADKLHAEAQTYIDSVNVSALSTVVKSMNDLNATLNQEYNIVVVYGDRRQPDNDNRIVRYYYKIQNKDRNGNIIPRTIVHEETKQKMTVRTSGYRVGQVKLSFEETPQTLRDRGGEPEAYRRLVADIKDNDIIDNDKFGKKERGHLHEEITMLGIPKDSGEYPYD